MSEKFVACRLTCRLNLLATSPFEMLFFAPDVVELGTERATWFPHPHILWIHNKVF